ncbi:MAG: hypothetical protein EOO39_42515, partial [Cytophagaceae bacterium]
PTTAPTTRPTTAPTSRPTASPTATPIPLGLQLTFSQLSSDANVVPSSALIPALNANLSASVGVFSCIFQQVSSTPFPRRVFGINIADQGPIVVGKSYQIVIGQDTNTNSTYFESISESTSRRWKASSGTLRVISTQGTATTTTAAGNHNSDR